MQQLIITQHFIRGEKPLARCTVDAFPGGGSHHKNQICRHRDLWWRTFSALTFELGLGQVQGLDILHTLVTASEKGERGRAADWSEVTRAAATLSHAPPPASPSGKSELRGKSGDKKLIWQISGWTVEASGAQARAAAGVARCRWFISGAHLTVWTQISSDSGVTTVNMSSVQCPVSSVQCVQLTNNVYPHPHSQLIILHILYSSLTIIALSWYLAAS